MQLQRRIYLDRVIQQRKRMGFRASLAKRIIDEYHSGELTIASSEVGVGTTMQIRLNTT